MVRPGRLGMTNIAGVRSVCASPRVRHLHLHLRLCPPLAEARPASWTGPAPAQGGERPPSSAPWQTDSVPLGPHTAKPFGFVHSTAHRGCFVKHLGAVLVSMPPGNFVYAVQRGRQTGVFDSWGEAEKLTRGFPGAVHRKFPAAERETASLWAHQGSSGTDLSARGLKPESSPKGDPGLPFDPKTSIYAVQVGRQPGLYPDWPSAQAMVLNYPGAKFRKFAPGQKAEATAWVNQAPAHGSTCQVHQSSVPKEKTSIATAKTVILHDNETPAMHGNPNPSMYAKAEGKGASAWASIAHRFPPDIQGELSRVVLSEPEAVSGGKVNVWCDGSSLSNGQKEAQAGWGVYFPSASAYSMQSEARRLDEAQTNNRGELMAIKRVCEIVPPDVPVRIHTDSQYSIKCLTVWSSNWAKNNWTRAGNQEIQNKMLIQDILSLFEQRSTPPELVYVKGHSQDVGNSAADLLARHGAGLQVNQS